MTRAIAVISILLSLGAVFSCHRHSENALLAEADSLMFIDPGRSLSLLESVKDIDRYSSRESAEYAFLLSQARSRNHIMPADDSLINVAVKYYEGKNDLRKRAWTYVVASDVYDMLDNDSLAIFYARDAEVLSRNIDDIRLKCYANYFLGYMLRYQQPYEESNHYLNEAIRYAKEFGDTLHIILPLSNLGVNSLFRNNLDDAIGQFHQARSYCTNEKYKKYLPTIDYNIAFAYKNKGDLKQAITFIENAQKDSLNKITDWRAVYSLKSNIMAELRMWDSIPYYAMKGMTDSSFISRGIYDLAMMKWAEGKGDYRLALDYSRKYAEMIDSMYKEESESKVMEMQKKYDVTQATLERDRLQIKNQRMGLIVLGLIVICLGAMIALLLYRRRIKEVQRQRDEVKAELTRYTIKMMNQRNRRLLADERRRHRLLALNDVIAKVMSTSRREDAEQLKKHNDMALTNDETAKLIEAVDVCYEGYVTQLHNDHLLLGPNDLALCCMILLKVPNRDIAILFGLSTDTLKKRKLRLRTEKLGINEMLEEWLERESRVYVDAVDAKYVKPEDNFTNSAAAPKGETVSDCEHATESKSDYPLESPTTQTSM